ncbi:proto-oncogene serine/threonine-protein kinase mos [Megalops cyprinoides]|uniref:proto-oncogene serine/threonine-protein kinase mos n=1 Tax=Megalops cyprinoides TaxID=118141 RepID=UPI001864E375|nr:proto-oncogene serine/threonine-protein kinase mos [Megalops cyprinoides]
MPSPIPLTRLLPKKFYPSTVLGACSSPLVKYAKDSTLRVPTQSFHGRDVHRVCSSVINWKELRSLHPIGSGGFGAVYRGFYFGETVAVKKVRKWSKNKLASRQSFWSELNAAHLQHKNIVRIIAATTCSPASKDNEDSIGTILMEYVGCTNLQNIIYGPADALGRDRCVKYSKDIANGLLFLHSHSIVHLDLKPANVLVSEKDVCKIADFGCSQKLELDRDLSPVAPHRCHIGGTYTHRAPELLKGDDVTLKADIYSFGITLWQLITREQPYDQYDRQPVLYAVVAYNLRPSLTNEVFHKTAWGQACKSLVCECWNGDPRARPSSRDLVVQFEIM